MASLNNLTLKLNYFLASKEEYLSDPLWVKYGTYREFTALSKCFFVSNHCLNFFFYIVFNQMFRNTLLDLLKQACSYLSFKLRLGWCVNRFKNCCNRSISNWDYLDVCLVCDCCCRCVCLGDSSRMKKKCCIVFKLLRLAMCAALTLQSWLCIILTRI